MSLEKLSSNKHYEGTLAKYKFRSVALGDTYTQFNLFLPANAAQGKVPVLVYLAGLTCTEDNGYVLNALSLTSANSHDETS
jgi:S-formylglutathione hydrolase